MKNYWFLPLILAMVIGSCQHEDPKPEDCPGDLVCTAEFKILTVRVLQNNETLQLDQFRTTNMDTKEIYNFEGLHYFDTGVYPIVSDGEMDKLSRDGSSLRFEGYVNGALVVDQLFLVGHNCCHIVQMEGPEVIELQ